MWRVTKWVGLVGWMSRVNDLFSSLSVHSSRRSNGTHVLIIAQTQPLTIMRSCSGQSSNKCPIIACVKRPVATPSVNILRRWPNSTWPIFSSDSLPGCVSGCLRPNGPTQDNSHTLMYISLSLALAVPPGRTSSYFDRPADDRIQVSSAVTERAMERFLMKKWIFFGKVKWFLFETVSLSLCLWSF